MRIPVEGYYEPQSVYGASVLVPDVNANEMFVKEFIYNIKVAGGKDLPVYMQNDFHMDDGNMVSSKPKPNIPNYNTPEVPTKSDDEQSDSIIQPGANSGTDNGSKDNNNPTTGTSTSTGSSNTGSTGNSGNTGNGGSTGTGSGNNNGGSTGTSGNTGPGSNTGSGNTGTGNTGTGNTGSGNTGTTPATP
jgi:hypothetical protein